MKNASDIILINDNIEAIVKAVMWGRTIFRNITKFLKYQLTVNISALVTIAIGIFAFGESPLGPF